MSYYNQERRVPRWVTYVGLAVLAVASLGLAAYLLTQSADVASELPRFGWT